MTVCDGGSAGMKAGPVEVGVLCCGGELDEFEVWELSSKLLGCGLCHFEDRNRSFWN